MQIDKITPANYFRNGHHKAAVNIIYTSNWYLEKLKHILQGEDITPQQYNILRILSYSDKPISTLQIREQMLDKMSDSSRIVDRLIKKELVNKAQSAKDKRLVDVTITAKGRELLQRLDGKNDQIDGLLDSLSLKETETLNELLDKLRGKDKAK